jgi:CheY-like chemotaxis protein
MRILVVEDHLDTLTCLSKLLALRGHDVATAATLETARVLCEHGSFDFIICDLSLPDGDGCELAEIAKRCNTKAIALTGYGMPEDIDRTTKAGFCAHLTKPVDWQAVEAAMAAC